MFNREKHTSRDHTYAMPPGVWGGLNPPPCRICGRAPEFHPEKIAPTDA